MTDPTPQYAEMARLLEAATPGPWRYIVGTVEAVTHGNPGIVIRGKIAELSIAHKASDERDANAALIVAAVNALPDMLTALQSLQAENERLRGGLEQARCVIGVMFGQGPEAIIPETIATPIGVLIKLGAIVSDIDAALSQGAVS